MLRLYRNHIQHFLTLSIHVLSLTLLPTSLILHIGANSWLLLGRKLPLTLAFFFGVVLTSVFQVAFPVLTPRLVSFDAACLQDSSCQWFAYLPGLSLHVPRRLWKERDSNPRCPTLYSPPIQGTIQSAAIPVLPSTTQPSFLFFVHFLCIFAQAYLSIFRSSYNPSAMFCAIRNLA